MSETRENNPWSPRNLAIDDLLEHLQKVSGLDAMAARRIVEEVISYFDEPLSAFVRRRHREMQSLGMPNSEIFLAIQLETVSWRFKPGEISTRQIRRLIYG